MLFTTFSQVTHIVTNPRKVNRTSINESNTLVSSVLPTPIRNFAALSSRLYAIKTNSSYRRFFHSSKPVFVALADYEPLKQYASMVEELIDGKVVIKSPKGLKLVLSLKFI